MVGKYFGRLRLRIRQFARAMHVLLRTERKFDEIKFNQGRLLSNLFQNEKKDHLWEYEFKVFSQWGEDGIIQFLTSNLAISNRTFIEFGVEDFYEANCRFLLMKDVWQGYVIDGSEANIATLEASDFFWRYSLKAKAAFVTRENIRELMQESGFDRDLGILSIDIDGVDYFILEELEEWRPRILIVEYNGLFGRSRAVSVPYSDEFVRTSRHYSGLYYGASLAAFETLAKRRGYALVGVNSVGSNAFFVRRELLNEFVREVSVIDCFRKPCFREGRDSQGRLSFYEEAERRRQIADLPLIDVLSKESLRVGDLQD